MLNLREYRTRAKRLSDFLPWAALVAPGVVLQKDRLLQTTLAFRGPDLASASGAELQAGAARLNNALKRLSGDWALFAEAQRFETTDYPERAPDHPVAWLIDEERRGAYETRGAHFDSSYYLTLVWLMPAESAKRAAGLFIEDKNRDARDAHYDAGRDLAYFRQEVAHLLAILRAIFPDVHALDDDETLSYLHSSVSTRRHRLQAPETPIFLDALLTDQDYQAGEIPVLGDAYVMTATLNGFPSESWPGVLDRLNHLAIPYRWSSRFLCLDKARAQAELKKYRRQWFAKRKGLVTLIREQLSGQESRLIDTEAEVKAQDADAALMELGADVVAYGYYTATVTVWDPDLEACRLKMERVCAAINNAGFATKVETTNSFQAWLSSLPGHVYANVRRPLLNTLNLAHLFPLSAIWSGAPCDEHLAAKFGVAAPLMVCDTTGATPFRLNLNVGDVGHTAIFGPTGAGKTSLLCMLALQWRRYPRAQVIILDVKRGARAPTLAMGGSYYEPGNPDRPVAFQPLADVDTEAGLAWADTWIEMLLELQGVSVTPHARAELHQSLVALAGSPQHERTVTGYQQLLQHEGLREALAPYTLGGAFGQIFDSDHDTFRLDDWLHVEMEPLMELGEAAVLPALSYLFRRLEARFGGRPTLLVLDECWFALSHPFFASRLKKYLKMLRSKSVYVVFATQEIEDAVDSSIAATILASCQTKIFLPNAGAMDPAGREAYARCGLTDTEIQLLQTATPKRHYFYRSPAGKRLFDMELGPVALAFAGRSSDQDQRLLDELEATCPPGEIATALLRDRGLEWAIDLLAQAYPVLTEQPLAATA